MSDICIRRVGKAGRITLQRPDALNALTYDMALSIEAALLAWRDDADVAAVIIDAEGERAFCSGGDIQEMYRTGTAGDFDYGRRFWADEYRLNALIAAYPKPYVALMHGFTMGGGVGVSAHGSHRIVCESSQIAMPECGIGLVPDVGGSLLLANGPGRVGEYLGLTGARMDAGDAIFVGFADIFVPQAAWPSLIRSLEQAVDRSAVDAAIGAVAAPAPVSKLAAERDLIDRYFSGESLRDIVNLLTHTAETGAADGDWAAAALKKLSRPSPLSMGCAVELIHRARMLGDVPRTLAQEYRFTYRCMEHGDFLEGIRAQVIDKDRSPRWRHERLDTVGAMEVSKMLLPLGHAELRLAGEGME